MGDDDDMTREQFEHDVVDIESLIQFCNDYGYEEFIEDIMDEESANDFIMMRVREMAGNRLSHWSDIGRFLYDIPESAYYYYIDSDGDIVEYDNDYLNDTIYDLNQRLIEDDFFDLDDDEDDFFDDSDDGYDVVDLDQECEQKSEEDQEIVEEDISIMELISFNKSVAIA